MRISKLQTNWSRLRELIFRKGTVLFVEFRDAGTNCTYEVSADLTDTILVHTMQHWTVQSVVSEKFRLSPSEQ